MSESQALSFDQLIGAPVMAFIIDQFTRLETMAILTIPIIYFLLAITNRFSLQDKDGNKIPSGPLGLPILGTSTTCNRFNSDNFSRDVQGPFLFSHATPN